MDAASIQESQFIDKTNSSYQTHGDLYWQIVRGIAIVCVVLIHSKSVTILDWSSFDSVFYFFARNIINFPVALFFFVSGFFTNEEFNFSLFRKRIVRLMLPYLIFAFLYMIINIVSGDRPDFMTALKWIFLGEVATPFYYIIVLLYFTLLTPLLVVIKRKKMGFIVFVLSFLCILVGYLCELNSVHIWSWLKYTPIWLMFYYGGLTLKNRQLSIPRWLIVLLCLLFYGLQLAETVLFSNGGGISYSQMKITGLLYSWSIIILFLSLHSTLNKKNIFSFLGDNSYGIFYLHFAALIIINKILSTIKLDMPIIVIWFIQLFFSLTLSIIIIFLTRLILKKKLSRLLFGF